MVHDYRVIAAMAPSFPRASGDGPLNSDGALCNFAFPPRERGWSPRAKKRGWRVTVSPARAGMVPKPPFRKPALTRFPRASGDGPCCAALLNHRCWFPPRERGWSPHGTAARRRDDVSPARAGMVPDLCAGNLAVLGFPRASGDGPLESTSWLNLHTFPPRERGWSLVSTRIALRCHVSPARAGMVPCHRRRALPGGGFPRASGDGPSMGFYRFAQARFPPRERGWSLSAW